MEREAVLVGIDVGTSKVCTLIGEVSRDGRMTVMGHGTVASSGLKKGVVVNIDQTVRSIAESVERAERLSGWKIDRAFVAVGGQHVESLNSPGQVAIAMRFGNHQFDPGTGYPSYYQITPFPFTRTLWLRPREYGYFSWTEIERTMVWTGTELEVGFGGVFGPGTVRTGQISFRTDTLTGLDRFMGQVDLGGLSRSDTLRSMEIFAAEVAPVLKREIGKPSRG